MIGETLTQADVDAVSMCDWHDVPNTYFERQVLGSVLSNEHARDTVLPMLTHADFEDARHGDVFGAVQGLWERGVTVDPMAAYDALRTADSALTNGLLSWLHELINQVVTPYNADWCAERIIEARKLTMIRITGDEIRALHNYADVDDAVMTALKKIQGIQPGQSVATTTEHQVDEAIASIGEYVGPPTPWSRMNACVYGWKPGELVVIGARPAVGKSACAVEIATDLSRRGHHTMLFLSLIHI